MLIRTWNKATGEWNKVLGCVYKDNENVDKDVCWDKDRKCNENDHNIGIVEALSRKEGAKNKTFMRIHMNVTLLSSWHED